MAYPARLQEALDNLKDPELKATCDRMVRKAFKSWKHGKQVDKLPTTKQEA